MYIRTKDNIYEVTNNKYGVIEENGVFKIHCENMGHHWYSELEVIKQSENLEELCDEFCYIKNGVVSQYLTIDFKFKRDDEFCALRNKLTANGIAEISKGISKYELENGELKFAIWTSKGLIYVAKMDNEGKLELI